MEYKIIKGHGIEVKLAVLSNELLGLMKETKNNNRQRAYEIFMEINNYNKNNYK